MSLCQSWPGRSGGQRHKQAHFFFRVTQLGKAFFDSLLFGLKPFKQVQKARERLGIDLVGLDLVADQTRRSLLAQRLISTPMPTLFGVAGRQLQGYLVFGP